MYQEIIKTGGFLSEIAKNVFCVFGELIILFKNP